MIIQISDFEGNPVSNVASFKEVITTGYPYSSIAEINIYDANGILHILKVNPKYMGGGYAYFLTHTGFGRGQLTDTSLEELVKEGGIIDTFLKDAEVRGGGRRGKKKGRKSRKANKKTRRTHRH